MHTIDFNNCTIANLPSTELSDTNSIHREGSDVNVTGSGSKLVFADNTNGIQFLDTALQDTHVKVNTGGYLVATTDISELRSAPTWTTPTTINSPFTTPTLFGSAMPMQLYKEPNGRVHMRGALQISTSSFTDGQLLLPFTMPAAYRPEQVYVQDTAVIDITKQNVNADGDLISGSWQFYIRSNGYFFLMAEQQPFLISSVTSVVIYFNTSYWGTP